MAMEDVLQRLKLILLLQVVVFSDTDRDSHFKVKKKVVGTMLMIIEIESVNS